MKLPDDVEIIIIDDGSDPPLKQYFKNTRLKNFNIYPTCDFRPWTQPCARNLGAKIAEGEYILMTDIDHILTKELIDVVYKFKGDRMLFTRQVAVLTARGEVTQNMQTLVKYGYPKGRYKRRGVRMHRHTGSYAMKRKLFWEIGGYDPQRCEHNTHPTHDDLYMHMQYRKYCKQGKCKPPVEGPMIYVFPPLSRDIKGLFHNLKR
jgi:glycosyltransferase involved in cell wall biosynthesis